MKKLGLVGGINWASTIDYYRYINEGIHEKAGGLNYAECIIYSLNYGDIHAIGWTNSFDLLLGACKSLQKSGADAIVLCANTAHQFAEELEKKIDLPIIHIVSATADAVNKQGFKKIGLLGTKFTMEMDFFKTGLKNQGIEAVIPEKEDTRNYIQHTLKEELGAGIINEATKKEYISIINELIAAGAKGIILGCTEIPMIISQDDISVPVFDTTKIHSQAAVTFALANKFKKMKENFEYLPEELPVPIDDGACDHLIGLQMPDSKLKATNGEFFFEKSNRKIGSLFISNDCPLRNPITKRLG